MLHHFLCLKLCRNGRGRGLVPDDDGDDARDAGK